MEEQQIRDFVHRISTEEILCHEGEGSSFYFTLLRVTSEQQEAAKELHNFALLS